VAILIVCIVLGALSSVRCTNAQEKEVLPDELVVDNFNKGKTSGLFSERSTSIEEAFQGTFAKRPSWTVITKSDEHRRGDKGLGLVIEFNTEAGWCGWYTLLKGVDITAYNTLSFWVKGAEGGERFEIGMGDQEMQDLEIDAVYAGPILSFVPEGSVTTEWQQAKIPLARIGSEIDLSRMGSIVFWFKYEGRGRVYVDDIKFINDSEIGKIADYNYPVAERNLKTPRSMWVWKIDPVLNPRQREELFKICERTGIGIIYLYFGATPQEETEQNREKLAKFLRECHQRHIEVEALTGNPVWALKPYHHVALDWVKGFLEYNKTRPEEERIDGVSLDVEPYLTQEWNTNREEIKADYMVFLKDCRELIDSYKGQDFVFGMAIPLFYDREEGGEFEKRMFEYIDYAALMDYYDTADDIITKARFHIDLAKKMGKKVTIGVETQNLVEMKQGKPRNTFYEEGWEEMEGILQETTDAYQDEPSFNGVAIHCYYSYRLLTRGRNVPMKERPKDIYTMHALPRGTTAVTIDGDLSEWDTSSPLVIQYKDNVVYGKGGWFGNQDLSTKFYSMWDNEALYFAFDVTDDNVIQERTGTDIWEHDHIEFWIDADLMGDYNEAMNSNDDFQFGFSPGNFTTLKPEVIIWTPSVKDELKNTIAIGSQKTKLGYIIEVKMPPAVFFQRVAPSSKLEKGLRLGVMVDPSDCDKANVPQESLMSSSTNRVWGDPTTFGILELQ
jgi:hypothetical protein